MGDGLAYQVVWSKRSLGDLRRITTTIAAENPTAAEATGLEILRRIQTLRQFRRSGVAVPEVEESTTRQVVCSPFRIIYRIRPAKKQILVLRIWHGARGQPRLGRRS